MAPGKEGSELGTVKYKLLIMVARNLTHQDLRNSGQKGTSNVRGKQSSNSKQFSSGQWLDVELVTDFGRNWQHLQPNVYTTKVS